MKAFSADEKTGETGVNEVVQTFVNQTYELVHVKLEDGDEIICTPSHPFYTDKGWIGAGKLTEDILLAGVEGSYKVPYKELIELGELFSKTRGS